MTADNLSFQVSRIQTHFFSTCILQLSDPGCVRPMMWTTFYSAMGALPSCKAPNITHTHSGGRLQNKADQHGKKGADAGSLELATTIFQYTSHGHSGQPMLFELLWDLVVKIEDSVYTVKRVYFQQYAHINCVYQNLLNTLVSATL